MAKKLTYHIGHHLLIGQTYCKKQIGFTTLLAIGFKKQCPLGCRICPICKRKWKKIGGK